jgi:hypothetical protein
MRIVPTRQVAAWEQYEYSGKLDDDDIDFESLEKRIEFLIIDYKRNPIVSISKTRISNGSNETLYEQEKQDSIARQTFVNVKPDVPGLYATTLRGNCLKCHNFRVSLFQTRDGSRLEYAPPLLRKGRDLLTPYFLQTMEPELRKTAVECQ